MSCEDCAYFYMTDIGTCDACQAINDDMVLFQPIGSIDPEKTEATHDTDEPFF